MEQLNEFLSHLIRAPYLYYAVIAVVLLVGLYLVYTYRRSNQAIIPFKTQGGEIEIAPCTDTPEKLCGFIASLAAPDRAPTDTENPDPTLRDRPLLGLPLFFDFVYNGEDKWKEGRIYNVENGKTYDSKLRLLDQDRLKLSGCVLFFCKSYTWHRAPETDTPANRKSNP